MMRLQTIQASALRTIFEVLKDIINDVNMYFTPTGLKILTLDTAHVTLVHMALPAENFEEYSCASDIIAGVNLANMYKLLKSVSNNDSLRMSIDDRHELLEIEIRNAVKNSSTQFHLKLLDINEDDLIVPDLEMDVVTTLPSIDFQRITRDMANLATEISIVRRGPVLELSCQGDFADQKTEIVCSSTEGGPTVGGVYPLKYINLYTKATNLCSSVQLFQHENLPLIIRYSIGNLGDVKFYLAQKTET
jgi:proliferating cell nuclear antigen